MKKEKPNIKCKQFYLLFIFLFSSMSMLFGQSMSELDGIGIAQEQDSLVNIKQISDSLNFQYVSVKADKNNYYLDSLKSIVLVVDNDFVGWMERMDKIAGLDHHSVQVVAPAKYHRPSWILLVVLALFVSIGLIRIFFFINFHNIVYGFYNDRVLAQINREDTIATSWPYIFLYAVFTLCLGLFVTLYRSYVLHLGEVEFVMFLNISVGIALLFLMKIVFVRFIGVLFQVEKLVREYVVFLYLFYFNSVLFLMPLLLLVVFLPFIYFSYVLILFLAIVSILFFYRFLRIVMNLIDGLRFSIFYLILYLCTLEIAPILILVKSLNN